MLTELSIRNFAIIDDISISFKHGLTVLTGETGAGKSIIIDAVQLLTGHRASSDYVRHGSEKAEIIGQFIITESMGAIKKLCYDYDIFIDENTVILERTITSAGKSICRVNGKIVTLSILREIGARLVSIHSQHDTIHLTNRNIHIDLLDNYNEKTILPIKEKYRYYFYKMKGLQKKYEELNRDEQQIAHRLDLLQFQIKEIEQANLEMEEDSLLELERKQLQNFEQIYRALQSAYDALSGEGKGLELIYATQDALQTAKNHDAFIENHSETATNIYYQLEDLQSEIKHYMDELFFDEDRLNEIESRLNELNRLKKKYGSTVKEMLDYLGKISKEVDEIKNRENHQERLGKQIKEMKDHAIKQANILHGIRQDIAKQLEVEVERELADLYLDHATLKVAFHEKDTITFNENGTDEISFLLSTNLGEPLKEIEKVASGGELSRVMLALKKIFANQDNIGTVIFDEIDTGVSGRVAQAIAEKMYQISSSTQTLCITHLPQVAAMADQHMLIKKIEEEKRTTTNLYSLDEQEQVQELGNMITGSKLTETALEHAQELLELTSTFKKLVNGKFND